MSPTALIGLNEDLKVPKSFSFVSNAKPSTFAYPEMLKKEVKEVKEKVETATLSTSAKVAARNKRKGGGGAEDAEMKSPEKTDKKEEEEEKAAEEKKEEKEPEPEPEADFQLLQNPSRVMRG